MRIFVTGASGYLGRALCARLAAGGHEVRALVRPTSRTEPLLAAGAATFVGDVTDRFSLREGMSGADVVVHAAAELSPTAPRARMEAVNVGGSENVAALAWKLGVPRLLSISSVVYFGGSPADGTPADEDSPLQLPLPTPYADTKHRGERAIQAWAERGLATVTVFPGLVYGPPGKKEGANALLRQLLLGRFPVLVGADRLSSWVHLDDVVAALLRALERAQPGARYLLAGESVTVRELARRVAALGGAPVPRRELSVGTARVLLRLAAPLWRLRGRRPPLARAQLDALARHWCFDDRRARAELDWQPRGLETGLPGTIEYLRRAG